MTRELSTTALNALAAANVNVALFCKLELDGGTFAVHNWTGELTIGGTVYNGVGELGAVSGFNENGALRPDQIQVTLHWANPALIAATQAESFRNKPMQLTVGLFDDQWDLLESFIVWDGATEFADIGLDENGDAISVTGSRVWADWNRKVSRMYTSESQADLFPGDQFFDFVSDTVDKVGRRQFLFGGETVSDTRGYLIQPEGGN